MNCWYTVAMLRFRTDLPVTSAPFTSTRPEVGRSRPAINRRRDVLPARVRPSRILREPASKERPISLIWVSRPTFLVIPSKD
jgi:hypothetical protein